MFQKGRCDASVPGFHWYCAKVGREQVANRGKAFLPEDRIKARFDEVIRKQPDL